MSAAGKRRVGVCGHIQESVVSQFYVCVEGPGAKTCSGKPRCPKCGSTDVRPFAADGLPPGTMHCWLNGHVFSPGASDR